MPKEQIITGLDIGTCFTRTVVAKLNPNQEKPQIVGVGQVPTFGIRRGVVFDIEEVVSSITQSVQEAERSSGINIEKVIVSLNGTHITSRISKGVVAVSRADAEVSKEDVGRVIKAASAISVSPNREIFHVLPRSFSVDEQKGIQDPVGMSGVRLEVDALLVEAATPFIKNINKCISEAGLGIDDMVFAPLAASYSALNKRQKELGILALDLGGGTTGLTVFEESDILHSCVLPVGSAHITNDVAIGLRSDIDLAERVKLDYGTALARMVNKKDNINLAKINSNEQGLVPKAEVINIMEARLREILELTGKELKKIDRQGLLPGGVVLLGGGAKMPGLIDLTKEELKLPVQVGYPIELEGIMEEVRDPSYATAVGLVLWGLEERLKEDKGRIPFSDVSIGPTVGKLKKWLRGFMP